MAGTRIFVQRAIHDEFVQRMAAFAGTIRIGDGRDPDTQIGPLISRRQLERVMHYVDIGGKEARLVHGGGRPDCAPAGGFFVEPTVFADVRNDMTIAREEIFRPLRR